MLNKLVFLSALSVVALSGAAQAATFNPGTYTAVSKGNGGEVPVTVTFTKNAIESVKIGANKETPGSGSPRTAKAIRSLLKLTAFLPSLRKPVLTAQNFSRQLLVTTVS